MPAVWKRNTGGQPIYESQGSVGITGNGRNPVRKTFKIPVTKGRYDVRIKRLTEDSEDSQKSSDTSLLQTRFIQDQPFDVGGQVRVGMTVKASGQVNGTVDKYSALISAQTADLITNPNIPISTENPAWWFLRFARGYYHPVTGKLLGGGGMADTQIDIPAITAWAQFCETNNLRINAVFDSRISLGEALSKVARVGRGSISFASGKLGVVWDAANQPPVALFGPHNILPDTFSIQYTTEKTADEIIVRFFNSENFFKPDTIRITVPGASTTGQNPAEIDLFGVVYTDQAKREGNLVAASQLWRRRRISWETDQEGLLVSRGDVVLLSHDMTSWGATGRIFAAASTTSVTLDKPITGNNAVQWLAFRQPNSSSLTYHRVAAFEGTADEITLLDALPVLPGGDGDHHTSDYVWLFGPASTPGKKVKILSLEPVDEERIRITATDENPEYYASEYNLVDYAPGGNLSSSRLPVVSNLRATVLDSVDFNTVPTVNAQIDWDVSGPSYSFAHVFVKQDDGPYELLVDTPGRSARFVAKVSSLYTLKVVVFGEAGVLGGSNSDEILWAVAQGALLLEPPTDAVAEEYKVIGPTGDIIYGAKLSWTPSPSPWVSAYEVQTFVVGHSVDWHSYGTTGSDADFMILSPALLGVTYQIRVRALAGNGSTSVWEQAPDFYVTALDAPENAVVNLVQVALSNESPPVPTLELTWDISTDPLVDHYEVQFRYEGDAQWVALGTVGADAPRYRHTSILAGKVYEFRVRALTASGSFSAWEQAADFTVPLAGAPTSLAITSQGFMQPDGTLQQGLVAQWVAPADTSVRHYEVEGMMTSTAQWSSWGTSSSLRYEFRPAIPGQTYSVRVRTVDIFGSRSAWTTSTALLVGGDTTAPGAVSALATAPAIGAITLTWVNPSDADLDVVEVWSSATNNRNLATLAGSVRGTSLTHAGLNPNLEVTRYYWARAKDYSGNIGPWFPVSATGGVVGTTIAFNDVFDTTPPAQVVGLSLSSAISTASNGEQSVSLTASWSAVADADLSYYEVDIREGSGTFITFTVGNSTTYTWTGLKPGTSYTVRVRALDAQSNRGNYSATATHTTTTDSVAPSTPSGISALASVRSAFLSWTNGNTTNDYDLSSVLVYRHTSNSSGSATLIATVNAERGQKGGFTDTGLTSSTTYYYWVKARDTSGNLSGFSSVASVTTAQIANSDIAAGTITADRILAGSLTGDRFSTSTSLPGTITVGTTGVSIGTVKTNADLGAQNPATRINDGSTTIDPGKVLISGSTTLSSWRNGSDATKIEGGSIAANTITANKLAIGLRGVDITGISFMGSAENFVAWSAGTIYYVDDSGSNTFVSTEMGSASWISDVVYIYWIKGETILRSTTSRATAAGANNIVLATYTGGTGGVIANYGRTIIDGNSIVTGAVTADKIAANAITADKINGRIISADKITIGGVDTANLIENAVTHSLAVNKSSFGPDTLASGGVLYSYGAVVVMNAVYGDRLLISCSISGANASFNYQDAVNFGIFISSNSTGFTGGQTLPQHLFAQYVVTTGTYDTGFFVRVPPTSVTWVFQVPAPVSGSQTQTQSLSIFLMGRGALQHTLACMRAKR